MIVPSPSEKSNLTVVEIVANDPVFRSEEGWGILPVMDRQHVLANYPAQADALLEHFGLSDSQAESKPPTIEPLHQLLGLLSLPLAPTGTEKKTLLQHELKLVLASQRDPAFGVRLGWIRQQLAQALAGQGGEA